MNFFITSVIFNKQVYSFKVFICLSGMLHHFPIFTQPYNINDSGAGGDESNNEQS